VILETDASGAITRRYLRGNDEMIAQYDGTAAQYYLHDAQGSVRLLTDLAGTITDEYTYDAYGTLTAAQGTTDNRYLYTGQQFDTTTGHYHLRARQYDPSLGRFMGMDTWPLDYDYPV